MDKDETWGDLTGSDLDDDITVPGCYMLNIGIDGLPFLKIWILADYIRIFDNLQMYYDQPRLMISSQLLS